MNFFPHIFSFTWLTMFFCSEVISAECKVVSTSQQLYSELTNLASNKTNHICLEDGEYLLDKTLVISSDNTRISSLSNDPTKVILRGKGMKETKIVDNLVWVSASFVSIVGITLRGTGNHLVQVAGEQNADYFYMADCILQDAYEQLFKVSKDRSGKITSDFGIIERTIFEYTQGIGPNWYIGGIDVHTAKNWLIKDNAFFDIASPAKHIAEHAIHFWSNSIGTRVIGNLIVDSDRGIGFGMAKSKHYGGEIRNNFIYHGHYSRTQRPFADVGIVLESSTNTKVIENFVYLNSGYANAIEYRYRSLDKNLISNNVTNKRIKQRDFGSAQLIDNKQLDDEDYFQQQLWQFVQQHPLKARLASRLH